MLNEKEIAEIQSRCDEGYYYGIRGEIHALLADRAELQAEIKRLSEKLKRETERSEKYYIWYLKEKEEREAETARANEAEKDETIQADMKRELIDKIDRLQAENKSIGAKYGNLAGFNKNLIARAEKAEAERDALIRAVRDRESCYR